jgi:hypothetical protein
LGFRRLSRLFARSCRILESEQAREGEGEGAREEGDRETENKSKP